MSQQTFTCFPEQSVLKECDLRMPRKSLQNRREELTNGFQESVEKLCQRWQTCDKGNHEGNVV
jgi:hypothetical protein